MFRIKICGVTSVADGHLVAEAGADAVGLNFYEQSQRFVAPVIAAEISAALPASICRVGVFVNASSASIRDTHDLAGLDMVQLHGDEPPAFLRELTGLRVIRAFRCRDGLRPIRDYLDQCIQEPEAVLVDAYHSSQYGGTGQTADWNQTHRDAALLGDIPLVLAGGLNPHNVAQAIATVRPAAVDTASGVEVQPGKKDLNLVREFVKLAQSTFPLEGGFAGCES